MRCAIPSVACAGTAWDRGPVAATARHGLSRAVGITAPFASASF